MSSASNSYYPWQKSDWSKLIYQTVKERLAHAYLVYGPVGIGKFDFVLKFSKFLLCISPGKYDACNKCSNCKLHDSIHPNIKILMPESNSLEIKIDQVRGLTDFLNKTGHSSGLKIAIITDADRLNINAANALLKTLEEPSGASTLILCSSLPGLLSPTLRSRCQKFAMSKPDREETLTWLKENSSAPIDFNLLDIVTENGPLEILKLVESGLLEKHDLFIKNFLNLLKGKCTIQEVVDSACKLGERHSAYYLMQLLSKTMLMFFSNRMMELNSSEKFFVEILNESSLSRRDLAIELFRYYDQVAQSYAELGGRGNLNPQLITESLIWRGSQLNLC